MPSDWTPEAYTGAVAFTWDQTSGVGGSKPVHAEDLVVTALSAVHTAREGSGARRRSGPITERDASSRPTRYG
jgi:hypothetical protein